MNLHRRFVALGAAVVLVGGLAACSSPTPQAPSEGAAGALPADSFPKTVETIRGDIEIPTAPERIVVLDSQSVDVVAALGVEPIAYDIGTSDSLETLPWLDGALKSEFIPGLVGADNAVDYEAVLAVDPDLIIVDHWVGEGETFERLNAIAPTITNDVDSAVGWQERTTFLAQVLGIESEGERVISDTQAAIADQTKQLAPLAEETYNYIAFSEEQGGFWYGNGAWFRDFGLVAAEGQDNTHAEFSVISLENVSDFDSDVLGIWAMTESDKTALEADSRFNALPAVTSGKLIWLDYALAVATNVPGPLSTLYTVDIVAPQLLTAVEG